MTVRVTPPSWPRDQLGQLELPFFAAQRGLRVIGRPEPAPHPGVLAGLETLIQFVDDRAVRSMAIVAIAHDGSVLSGHSGDPDCFQLAGALAHVQARVLSELDP